MTSLCESSRQKKGKLPLLVAAGVLAMVSLFTGVAVSMDRLGDSLVNQGRFAEAIPFYEIATSSQKLLGVENQRSANAWTELGICYGHEMRLADALRVQNIAVEIRRNIYLKDPELRLATH